MLSFMLGAVFLWQMGFQVSCFLIFIAIFGISIVFSWWAPELSSDLSLLQFIYSELFFLGFMYVLVVQPSESVRSLLILCGFWVGYILKRLYPSQFGN